MTKIGQKFLEILRIVLGLYLVFFLIKLFVQLFFPQWGPFPVIFLPEDAFWSFVYELLRELLESFSAIILSTTIVTFSFWLKPLELPVGGARDLPAAVPLVRVSIIAIACSVVFAFTTLFALPALNAQLADISYRADLARQLEETYFKLKDSKAEDTTTLDAKLSLLQRLGSLRPTQGQYSAHERFDYEFELQLLSAHIQITQFVQQRLAAGVAEKPDTGEHTVPELLQLSEEDLHPKDSLLKTDEFGANLLAYQALKRLLNVPNPQRMADYASLMDRAKNLVDESWSRIYAKTIQANERLKASYFFRKGKSLGDYQFQNYLEAYYGLLELSRENPNDAEVSRYLSLSKEKLKGAVYFVQDLNVLFSAPGMSNVVFRNPTPAFNQSGEEEIVRIQEILDSADGVFVKGFELIRYTSGGKVLLHWKAPYGAWKPGGLEFNIWEKNHPQPVFPQVIAETPEAPYNPEESITPPIFKPSVGVRDLQVLANSQVLAQSQATWELMTEVGTLGSLGASPLPLQTEFFSRLFSPLGFFVLFILAFAFSWSLRSHEDAKIPRFWWVLTPLFPPVIEFLLQLLQWTSKILAGNGIHFFGMTTMMGAGFVFFIAASVAGLIWSWNLLRKY